MLTGNVISRYSVNIMPAHITVITCITISVVAVGSILGIYFVILILSATAFILGAY
jgi:hypothetical protein